MRKPLLAGNWKMNLDRKRGLELARTIRAKAGSRADRDVAVFPPFVYVAEIARELAGSRVAVGGQNCSDQAEGAFTGEVAARQLRDVGATHVILGHSERRHVYGEGDELVNRKVRRALADGLEVILCVGETLEERDRDVTEKVVSRQTSIGLRDVSRDDALRVTLAYEPVWAIGTGRNATPEQAGAVHTYLRGVLSGIYDDAAAATTRILYGGSVKPTNIQSLMAAPNVDGALVGGACLEPDSFLSIIEFSL